MRLLLLGSSLALAACATTVNASTYPSTYQPLSGPPTVIRNAIVLTGTGERIDGGDVLMMNGKIVAVGRNLAVAPDATVIDARDRWVTPGLIDVHSHLGVNAVPYTDALRDTNEESDPVTPNVWAEHSIWPQDPGFQAALAGGVTTLQVLPGSANLIGGRSVIVRNVPAVSYQAMKFPGAPHGLKMTCGENPKRTYGGRDRAPKTRMGNIAGYRQAFADAQDYREQWRRYESERQVHAAKRPVTDAQPPSPPQRDLRLETLVGVMKGEILVHVHCYRADDMVTMLDLADEFGFKVTAFHHAVEAYKIAELLAERGVCGALWADWWGFKMEAYDGIQENLALVDHPANGCAMLHSDSETDGVQRLNQEAAKAMARGVRMGLDIPRERAVRWMTANPARALGIADRTGTLEAGKMADVVIWNGDPFSAYALADQVFMDGALVFDRGQPVARPRSDFMLGQPTSAAAP
ncbi:amidohydrolase [Steroidobacter sp.]|uniref:amidohydrolase n=1 Tax=Steroidobacter sp. TaxID=1978227 RepID=UPI001A4DF4A2|nr:amidohydrolase [Steroidobacter sp.]MBL8268324.1 amidohydrolase [Steroidobacter sp.]